MDKEVEYLIMKFKIYAEKNKRLGFAPTKKEEKKYKNVTLDYIKNQLYNREPGEVPIPRSLNPEKGKIIYETSHGLKTILLKNLGYELRDGIWQKKIKKTK